MKKLFVFVTVLAALMLIVACTPQVAPPAAPVVPRPAPAATPPVAAPAAPAAPVVPAAPAAPPKLSDIMATAGTTCAAEADAKAQGACCSKALGIPAFLASGKCVPYS